jgi:hypothetical protein
MHSYTQNTVINSIGYFGFFFLEFIKEMIYKYLTKMIYKGL